jgi:heterodisulfide reductase subunit B
MGVEDVVAPCAACYNRMKSAEVSLKDDPELNAKVAPSLPRPFTGNVSVRSLLEILSRDEVKATVREAVKKRFEGLKVACYYGCLLVRPPKIVQFDDPEAPHSMDDLLTEVGLECVDWPHKTECCGASFALTRSDVVFKLVGDILSTAKRSGAQAIVTACPLCQTNLDTRQDGASKLKGENFNIPVYFFTELLAIALGASEKDLSLGKHFVDAKTALRR